MPVFFPRLLTGAFMYRAILSSIVVLALPLAGQTAERPGDHFHVAETCRNCHSDGIDVAALVRQNDHACLACHDLKGLNLRLNRAAEAPQGRVSGADAARQGDPSLGLAWPAYYKVSRYGEAPGPMIDIPAGPFTRGSDERLSDEGPQHIATTAAFRIDKYEVTNLQYHAFIEATGHRSPKHFRNRRFPEDKIDHPVTYVSWDDASAYCAWAGKRLPSDIEWEKAARGTDGREYPWGDNFELSRANMPLRWQALKQFGDTTPVGAFPSGASAYGVMDMTGNVWEWTASWYTAYPGNTETSENYGQRYRTLKGGSWFDCSFYRCGISAPVYNRAFFSAKTRNDSFGFRCAHDAN